MQGYARYAIYYAPPEGSALARFGAEWLGWNAETGAAEPHPSVAHLPRPVEEITARPRKYGFHGTLKAPFKLAEGRGVAALHDALEAHAAQTSPFALDGLRLARLGPFVALVPDGESPELSALASGLVTRFDTFRAPISPADQARRRAAGLTLRQETYLAEWGYPYVLDDFRFHLTLSGSLPEDEADRLVAALAPVLEPMLHRPWPITEIALFAEAADGRFRLQHRYPLHG